MANVYVIYNHQSGAPVEIHSNKKEFPKNDGWFSSYVTTFHYLTVTQLQHLKYAEAVDFESRMRYAITTHKEMIKE